MTIDRRTFVLGASGAVAATSLTPGVTAAANPIGSIDDVQHVVILMQENRSFDHYFGMLRGVRGFGDPRPLVLPNGKPVWAQTQDDTDGGETLWPFRLNTLETSAGCGQGLDHSWKGTQERWQDWDVWMPEKGPLSMGYMTREDLPYYYALADAFTICDAYHCSLQGPTGPNRLYHFSGSNGLSVGAGGIYSVTNDGCDDNPGADMAKDDPKFGGLTWTPYAERLEAAGVSWKVYQEYANFSDNPLGYFACFRKLDRDTSRYRRGRAWVDGSTPENAEMSRGQHLIDAFAADVAADRLPAVSWIVPQMQMSEHPDASPAYGQYLTGSLIKALAANPDVWAKTVFILNYDENDGFFDHVPPPIPATTPAYGASTVAVDGEAYHGEPVGLGARVPMMIVSPWTRGGWVNSQLFDHTSVLRFLEARFGVQEPNISAWRRAVCGDLTSAFDFDIPLQARRDTSWVASLPDVGDYLAQSDAICKSAPQAPIGGTQAAPQPEPGTRPARALPYRIDVETTGSGLRLLNDGSVAAVFVIRGLAKSPMHYTVGAGHRHDIDCQADAYTFTLTGPNGFYRGYHAAGPEARLASRVVMQGKVYGLELKNTGAPVLHLTVTTLNAEPVRVVLPAGERRTIPLPSTHGHRWYDVVIAGADVRHHLAGHFESGKADISEPARA